MIMTNTAVMGAKMISNKNEEDNRTTSAISKQPS